MEQSIFVHNGKENVYAGDLRDGTLYKQVDRKVHFLRNWNGYAVQKSVLDNEEIKFVEIKEKGWPPRVLRASADTWREWGRTINLGHGEQVALEERFMEQL